ncbi:MAG: hypothetical protein CXX73_05600 [Methanobacteriota archaeon]|nr:MAG: hypothetical protein CXX73_05600 [Euryarchaeota archaeon]HIN04361.1 hypothetical protein [Candidatus Poseidoniales archaeon]
MSTQKKSDSLSLTLLVRSKRAEALTASMATEADASLSGTIVTIRESAPTFVDLRARWNTVMRGLTAADEALKASRSEASRPGR